MMFAAGFEPYKVSRWLGHTNVAITDGIYSHLYPTDYSREAERLSAWLGESAPAPTAPTHLPRRTKQA